MTDRQERIAIIDGYRTPMSKAGGKFKDIFADDLAVPVVREVMLRTGVHGGEVDELIFGNVAQHAKSANIARVVAMKAGLPKSVPAYTINRNCASGMESITSAAEKIIIGKASVILAGGTESMSNIPLYFSREMTEIFNDLSRAKSVLKKFRVLMRFRPSYLKPNIAMIDGLTDPVSGLIMGKTAEVLAREFHITRREQDELALQSHMRASAAISSGIFDEEIVPFPLPPDFAMVRADSGPRENLTMEKLGKLPPYFDRKNGTVTVGNSCPITDAAAAVILMSETKARERGITPLGFLKDYAYAALEPERMGLGPVYAFSKLSEKTGITLKDIELIELNEAFAAQVLANIQAFESESFARQYLGRSSALGEIDLSIFNVHGGAIALGHPVGMTGTRLVIRMLRELRKRNKNTGLATLCIGGGQGAALLLEVA